MTLLGYFSICAGGTRNAYQPNSVPTDADETSIAGGHRGVHISYLQNNSGRPFDTDVHDEVSTMRKHSFQGEARRTIQVRMLRLEIVIHVATCLEAIILGGSPIIHKDSGGSSRRVQVCKNPFVTTLEARLHCAQHNIDPNFGKTMSRVCSRPFPYSPARHKTKR